jgi:hypothetical protein
VVIFSFAFRFRWSCVRVCGAMDSDDDVRCGYWSVFVFYVGQGLVLAGSVWLWARSGGGNCRRSAHWMVAVWLSHASLGVIHRLVYDPEANPWLSVDKGRLNYLRRVAHTRAALDRGAEGRFLAEVDVVYNFLASVVVSLTLQEGGLHSDGAGWSACGAGPDLALGLFVVPAALGVVLCAARARGIDVAALRAQAVQRLAAAGRSARGSAQLQQLLALDGAVRGPSWL